MDDFAKIRFTGAVYTPPVIAEALVAFVKDIIPEKNKLQILEPSVGDGAFLDELTLSFTKDQFTVVDIDSAAIKELIHRIKQPSNPVSFITKDFIEYSLPYIKNDTRPFDLIIGNPPFIRRHNFSDDFKETLDDFSKVSKYPLKDLKNSWAAFLVASARLVSNTGVVALILPYELMTVDYGQKVLQTLADEFIRIDIFVSNNKAFPDIDQDAVIFVGQKNCVTRGLYIKHVESLFDLTSPHIYKLDLDSQAGRGLEFNAFLLPKLTLNLLRELRGNCYTIEHYAGSAPGIVSAANEFFILKKSEVEALGIENYVIPILKKGSFASYKPIFSSEDFSEIEKKEPCFLLNIKDDFATLDKNLQNYIREGELKELHLRYKCRNRRNWFSVPIVPRELGFFFKRSHSFPRVCLNEAEIYLTDTSYGLRIKNGFSIKGLCYSFYNSLTLLFAETNGRFYGGGVLELSPTEFRGLPLVYHEPTLDEFTKFLLAHELARGDVEKILDFGDQWLQQKLKLSDEQMVMIRQGLTSVRNHRMRHGRRRFLIEGIV